jgi:anti-sigma-K factor RskA
VSVRRLADPNGYYEVWLATPSLNKMISVGLLQGDSGTFELPASVDPAELNTVDVSLEPLDGDPTHSATSVLRGTLQ